MPSEPTLDPPDHRQWLVEKVFTFGADFPDEFQKIQQLLKKHLPIEPPDEILRYELGKIVYLFKKRYRDPEYQKNIVNLVEQTNIAADALAEFFGGFRRLDAYHLEAFFDVVSGVAPPDIPSEYALFPEIKRPEILIEMEKLSLRVQWVAFAMRGITAPEAKPAGRSRPTLPYLMPTLRLMELWEMFSGSSVVSPKNFGKKYTEAIQPSTEFVRLALTMIDPKVTAANAITSIRNALATNKDMEKLFAGRNGTGKEIVLEILKELASGPSKNPI